MPRSLHTIAIIDLTAEELFSALHGLGLPNETKTTAEEVTALFLKEKIVSIAVKDVPNTGRCTLDSLTFANGTRLHLGASAQGAVAYRMVQAPSYAKRVLQEQL
jgi:hypothetical protein